MLAFSWAQWGCPNNTTPTDGGTQSDQPPQLTSCSAGSACLRVATPGVRSCDILLTHGTANFTAPQVTFDAAILGQFKFKDKRIALSWIMQADADPDPSKFVSTLQITGATKDLTLTTAICYDRKGAKIDKPDVTLQTP